MTLMSDTSSEVALVSLLDVLQQQNSSSSLSAQLCAALAKGPAAWREALQQQCQIAQQAGQTNLAALLHLVDNDAVASMDCYREAGCLREALAVASTRLLHADPAVQQLRQQYAASLAPTAAAEGDAPAQPTPAAAAARKGIKPHSEAAAANLLLLDQPVAAAMALASRDGGSNAAAMQTAAQVAALSAAHKAGSEQEALCQLAAQYSVQACLLLDSNSSSCQQQHPQLFHSLLQLLQPLAGRSHAAAAAVLVLGLAAHLQAVVRHAATAAAAGAAGAAAVGEDTAHGVAELVSQAGGALEAATDINSSGGNQGVKEQDFFTLQGSQASQLLAAMQLLWRKSTNGQQQQEAHSQQQQQQPADLHQELQRLLPPACLQQAASSEALLPLPGSPAACCCRAAAHLWQAYSTASTSSSSSTAEQQQQQVESAWEQHALPLLLTAVQMQQQQQQQLEVGSLALGSSSSAPPAPAAAAAVIGVHPKVPGRRLRYSVPQLHALSKSPLLKQLQTTVSHHHYQHHHHQPQPQQQQGSAAAGAVSLQQHLALLEVPAVGGPADTAAVATSIHSLLPGQRPQEWVRQQRGNSNSNWSGPKTAQHGSSSGTGGSAGGGGSGAGGQQQQQQMGYGRRQQYGRQQPQHSHHRGGRWEQQQQPVHPYDVPLLDLAPPATPPPPPRVQPAPPPQAVAQSQEQPQGQQPQEAQ